MGKGMTWLAARAMGLHAGGTCTLEATLDQIGSMTVGRAIAPSGHCPMETTKMPSCCNPPAPGGQIWSQGEQAPRPFPCWRTKPP